MGGLSDFGRLIFSLENDVRLFSERITDGPYERIKYYVIDRTGLSHGYIYGPVKEMDYSFYASYGERDRYYGGKTSIERICHAYDCVSEMNSIIYHESNPVTVDYLRENYLPLQNGNLDESIRYYEPHTVFLKKSCGDFIYKSDVRSFYLPIKELICSHLAIELYLVTLSVELKKTSIDVTVYKRWRTRKHDNETIYLCKISYDKFEIVSSELLDHTSEYDW
jgi:hypothetical protein